MTTIQAIRARALALRSSIHNETCLSAIELAAMNAKKTNEIIAVVNDLCTEIENLTLGLEVVYDPDSESLIISTKEG